MDVNELLPPGIYRIVVAELGKIGPNALTRQEGNGVTILPPGARLGSDQWWDVQTKPNGTVAIAKPPSTLPADALTYNGAPAAKEGAQVVHHFMDFPTEWRVAIVPGFRHVLQVAGTDLGIAIAPPEIHPPILELRARGQLLWAFERVDNTPT